MPLHIDKRPKDFDEFVGNKATVTSLKSLIAREDRPHVLLFHGPSGCGKTTLARIFAGKLGCDAKSIIEINTSDERGIATARNILDKMRYKAIGSDVRIYILDEVHSTTKDFQNAMLKGLEDTPPHVYFILCTTNPQGLLVTVRNRCTTLPVVKLSEKRLMYLLRKFTDKDGAFLKVIANYAEGCPRQALIILDQIIDIDDDNILESL